MGERKREQERKNWLDWAVFALGLITGLGLLGYFVARAITQDGAEPDLAVEFGAPQAHQGGHRLPVTVHNRGDKTARSVEVEVGMGEREVALDIDFVPARGEHEAWVWFPGEPLAAPVVAGLRYEVP